GILRQTKIVSVNSASSVVKPLCSLAESLLPEGSLERDVSVLLRRILVAFGVEDGERGDQLRPRLPRPDDFVDKAARCGNVRVGELLFELRDAPRARRFLVRRSVD